MPGCLGGSEELSGFHPRRERVTDPISLLWMELYLCCLVKQHKCKRGVNCFHISFGEQMRREMHFTGTSTGGVCLAWCNVEHLFLFPQGCWVISERGYCRGSRSRGWSVSTGGRWRALLSPALKILPSFCLTTSYTSVKVQPKFPLPAHHSLSLTQWLFLLSSHPQPLAWHSELLLISPCLVL